MGNEKPDPLEHEISRLSRLILSEDGEHGLLPRVVGLDTRVKALENAQRNGWNHVGIISAVVAAGCALLAYLKK